MQTPSGLKVKANVTEDAMKAISVVYSVAVSKYIEFGIPEKSLSGPIEFIDRPEGEEANGRFSIKTNTVLIYIPQRNNVAVDLLWSLVHEIAHRLWHRVLKKKHQEAWTATFDALGVPFPPEAVKARVASASHDNHNAYWFWYKKNIGSDLQGFADYLSKAKYAPEGLPREYSNASAEEAWADVVAHLVLGRSRNGSLMRKSGSEIRGVVISILKDACSDTKSEGTDFSTTKVIPSSLMRGNLFGDKPRRVVLYDTKPTRKDGSDANV